MARMDLEMQIDANLSKSMFQSIMADVNTRSYFLKYMETVGRIAAKRNSTLKTTTHDNNIALQTSTRLVTTQQATTLQATTQQATTHQMVIQHVTLSELPLTAAQDTVPTPITIHQLLNIGERGEPSLKIRGVALFMDSNFEKLGLSFCIARAHKNIVISPGLACLMNGSTLRTSMRRKKYEALPEMTVMDISCRLVRLSNKVIVLLPWGEKTPFAQACSVLTTIGEEGAKPNNIPRKISIDAMLVEHERGKVADRYGCIKASANNEVIVYEDRGENLAYLKIRDNATAANLTDSWGHPVPYSDGMSGSERLQLQTAEKSTVNERSLPGKTRNRFKAFVNAFSSAKQNLMMEAQTKVDIETTTKPSQPTKRQQEQPAARTRADKGQVNPPNFIQATELLHHAINAFMEFQAITKATREVNLAICRNIDLAYKRGNESLLNMRLEEADAAIYDNDKCLVIKGTMSGSYMGAYSETGGFVALDEEKTKLHGKLKFVTPPNDTIVVIARCTKVVLDDRILEMAKSVATWETWSLPKITWVNGVPGCGKTTWVVKHFDVDSDVIATTTTEAAKDLREKLTHRIGDKAKTKVRTMASILVNGFKEPNRCKRLMVDEALMNHFGAIIMAARLSGATVIVLIGDVNQLPYIDRDNLFVLRYNRPNLIATITQELLCTHRNPLDVAYALREVYTGIYSSSISKIRSLKLERFTGAAIPSEMPNTLFLVHTQEEKQTLTGQGIGKGTGSRILTIHEAQGLTYESVIILQTRSAKLLLHDSVPHAVVAVSRHTVSCVYYTDDSDDAIGRFIAQATQASSERIIEYNLMMAMRERDEGIIQALIKKSVAECL